MDFSALFSRINANRTNRIGRKRKCCIFATSIRSNAEMLDSRKNDIKIWKLELFSVILQIQ